jgi:elongation factor Ts
MTTTITAKAVSELRQRTGAGMMDCKKALEENQGDMEKAVEYLRTKGIAKAEKRASRAASEGRIVGATTADGNAAAILELNSETDFVSRNDEFIVLARALTERLATEAGENAVVPVAAESSFASLTWGDSGKTVAEIVKEASGKTGENVVLRRYARFASDGTLGTYVHHNHKVGVIVELGGPRSAVADRLAKDVAQHVAAGVPTPPMSVDRSGVPSEFIERERRIFEAEAKESGKPENVVAKMVEGKVSKKYAEVTLLEQPWIRDPAKTIKQLVDEASTEAGGALTVRRFVRFQMGEE